MSILDRLFRRAAPTDPRDDWWFDTNSAASPSGAWRVWWYRSAPPERPHGRAKVDGPAGVAWARRDLVSPRAGIIDDEGRSLVSDHAGHYELRSRILIVDVHGQTVKEHVVQSIPLGLSWRADGAVILEMPPAYRTREMYFRLSDGARLKR